MKRVLQTPISREDIADLRIGDVVYLSGSMATGRDDVHRRIVAEGMQSPYDFSGNAIYHAGPIVVESEGNKLLSVGPTSSIRMEDYAAEFIRLTGVRVMIGKGGMGERTAAACREYGALHCVFPGGCAVSAAAHIDRVEAVYWRELGMPECIWALRANVFGPLIVAIDTAGNNLFLENKAVYTKKSAECMRPIIDSVRDFMNVHG